MSDETFAEWIDETTGLPCRAVLTPHLGTWCGYVGVPLRHPWHGLGYHDLPDIDVHGGVTWAGPHDEASFAAQAMGSAKAEGVTWWIGFDCAHLWDATPGLDARMRELGIEPVPVYATFKDLDFVRAECASLAQQVVEARAANRA